MVTKQKQSLTYIKLLDELLFIKGRAEEFDIDPEDIKKLKFVKQDEFGRIERVLDFKLNLVKSGEEIVIIILNE